MREYRKLLSPSGQTDSWLPFTSGATFIGIVLATWVGGIACSEAIRYFRQFPNDNKIFKGVVGVISIINIAHTAMSSCFASSAVSTSRGSV